MHLCTHYAVVQAFCSAAVIDVRKGLDCILGLCLVLGTVAGRYAGTRSHRYIDLDTLACLSEGCAFPDVLNAYSSHTKLGQGVTWLLMATYQTILMQAYTRG